jgi:molybdenum cofactor biosynthesis enzyme MoaA
MNLIFKQEYCALNEYEPSKVEGKYVNIYVKASDACQAQCEFCVYHNKDKQWKFDIQKFKQTIDTLLIDGIEIRKMSFTGGEPSLDSILLLDCIDYVKKHSPNTFIVINSNGAWLNRLFDPILPIKFDVVSLSRHHYDDEMNKKIFRTYTIPSGAYLKRIAKTYPNKLHLSCNLVKGYIDSKAEILKYLEFANEVGIRDVGFVGLMPVNKFAKEHFVDLERIKLTDTKLIRNKEWHYKGICKCSNFLYLPKKGAKVVKFYARNRCNHIIEMGSNVVFDGQHLRNNFGGKIIY